MGINTPRFHFRWWRFLWESSAILTEARWQQKEIVLGQRGSSQDPRFPQEDFVLVTVPFFVIQQSDLALEGLPKFVLSLLRSDPAN